MRIAKLLAARLFASVLAAGLLVAEAHAWMFEPDPICTVRHQSDDLVFQMTYDGAIYRLELTHPDGWPAADVFSLQFAPQGPFISTTQHVINGNSLMVADTGFGNVLNGLQDNLIAIAILGATQRRFDLSGAAPVIAAFRACAPAGALS